MRICLIYVCVTEGKNSAELAARFVGTHHKNSPGIAHDTLVACNGGMPRSEIALIFTALGPKLWARKNDPGFDLSAYLEAARGPAAGYDMLLCCGESVHFHRPGWLVPLVKAWEAEGPGLYGVFSSNAIRPHLQTSCFATSPALLNAWTWTLKGKADRYGFEHGKAAFWRKVDTRSPVRLVTWDGVWKPREWRRPANILWRGDQSNCLAWNNHALNWFQADGFRRSQWTLRADSPFYL